MIFLKVWVRLKKTACLLVMKSPSIVEVPVKGKTIDVVIRTSFTSVGYADWPKYADEVSFKNGLTDYLKPSQGGFLMRCGVHIPELIFSMVGKGKDGQGFIEICT